MAERELWRASREREVEASATRFAGLQPTCLDAHGCDANDDVFLAIRWSTCPLCGRADAHGPLALLLAAVRLDTMHMEGARSV